MEEGESSYIIVGNVNWYNHCGKRMEVTEKQTNKQTNKKIELPSVQFSHSVLSEFLRPHESQHATPPCPSPAPGVHTDSRPLSP